MSPFCQDLEEDPNRLPRMRGNWFGCSGTTKAQACHELEIAEIPASFSTVKSFKSPWTKMLPSKKEAPAPKLTPSSLNEICNCHVDKPKAFWIHVWWPGEIGIEYFSTMTRGMCGGVKAKLPAVKHGSDSITLWAVFVSVVNCTNWMELWSRMTTSKFFNSTSDQKLDGWNLTQVGCSSRTMIPNIHLDRKKQANIKLPERASQIPHLHPICGLQQVYARKPTNLKELYKFWQEQSSQIKPELSQTIVRGHQKDLLKVPLVKGQFTKYQCIYLRLNVYFWAPDSWVVFFFFAQSFHLGKRNH